MNKKNAKKIILNTIFLAACMGLTLYFVFKGKDLSEVFNFVLNVNPLYTLFGVIFVLIFILLESIIFHYIFKSLKQEHKITHCMFYSFVGFFFSLVTPVALGGQPAQFLFMKKDKIPAHVASITLIIITITYKFVLVIIGVLVLFFRPTPIMALIQPVMFWMYLGTFLNLIVVASLFSLIFFPKFTKKMVVAIFHGLSKITKSNKFTQLETRAENSMEKYHETAEYIKGHKKVTLNVLWITFAQRISLFFVTYIAFLGFHIDASMPLVIVLQGMISTATEMLPLPGGLGVNELLFQIVFEPLTGPELITPVMVISRGLNYYIQLIICAIMTVIAYIKIFKKGNNNE